MNQCDNRRLALDIAYGLACEGRALPNGLPKRLLDRAVWHARAASHPAGRLPKGKRLPWRMLYWIARLAGTERRLRRAYSRPGLPD
ncbi:hypothetical protein ACTHPH_02765 [Paenibacillus pasadenensis]|uniref:hypothetical protein n=1 Tax=Paenibacillus TaxID=44249 RepID=UPI0004047DA5|nr:MULTISPECIES: hypothetical protein [Paenibacillus]QGG56566.1 hypothetical protein GE073_13900 [Paenibacillus sp. B01]